MSDADADAGAGSDADADIDVVLFDLGGVLMDFGGVGPMKALAGIAGDDELWDRWLSCRWVRDFERGRCSASDFAAGVVADWGLAVTPDSFLRVFASWPVGPFPGAREVVESVRRSARVGCLSNTNEIHWARLSAWPVLAAFDDCFLSFEMGMVKPDSELFDAVAAQVAVSPSRILFLDDVAANVSAARHRGFRAELCRGVDGARRTLAAAGLRRN